MKKTKKAEAKIVKKIAAKKPAAAKVVSKRMCGRCGRYGFNSRTCKGSQKSHDE